MQATIPFENFQSSNIYVSQRTENTVVAGGGFYRVMYCSQEGTLLGIPILISIDVPATDSSGLQSSYEKACEDTLDKITFLMNSIYKIWKHGRNSNKSFVIGKASCVNLIKQAVQKAFDVKLPKQNVQYRFLFKCSGIFDTHNEVGITYRFSFVNHQ